MTPENIKTAIAVLYGRSLGEVAKERGVSRGRVWQITHAFCLEYFLPHMLRDDDGKERDLKGLRYQWQNMLTV